jgi:RNA 3'-terminal phosphate cyclase (ATP)
MVTIDGSFGEGGGQILRSALGLSLYTGIPFKIINIRAKRKKSGLLRQHLTAVNGAVEISNADVEGNSIGSDELLFKPGEVMGGNYHFAIGTAGSTTLVMQAILPGIIKAEKRTLITFEGGTHNPMAPPYDFLKRSFLPLLKRMGIEIEAEIERYGFYPAGGGKFIISVKPGQNIAPLNIYDRGDVKRKSTRVVYSKINNKIAVGEMNMIRGTLNLNQNDCTAEEVPSPGPGNAAFVEVECENITYIASAFGEKRVTRKQVVATVCTKTREYLESDAAVCEHLADQLLIPMAIAGEASFTTVQPTLHTETNIEVIKKFLNVSIEVSEQSRTTWKITVRSN